MLDATTILRAAVNAHVEGRLDQARAVYHRALAVDPALSAAWRGLATLAAASGALDVGAAAFKRALNATPVDVAAWVGLAKIAVATLDLSRAASAARRGLALAPGLAEAQAPRAMVAERLGDHERAVVWWLRAHRLAPASRDALANLAASLRDAGLFDASHAALTAILNRNGDDQPARLSRAVTRLVQGDLVGGWEDFEARWTRFPTPPWRGGPIAGKSILLHAEQGFGDTIQFARYAPLVADLGAKVTLLVHDALVRLLSAIDPRVTVTATDHDAGEFDHHCPLMSLPRAFATTLATIPPPLRLDWRAQKPFHPRPRVGLVWSGNPAHRNDHHRSINAAALAPLRQVVGVDWISLQTDMGGRATIASTPWLDALPHPLDGVRDFADTAQIVAGLDLVICVDTAMAHLVGSMGKPCWVLLPRAPDWRWLTGRSDTPWYPSLTLFRQGPRGGWPPVIEAVAAALLQWVATRQDGLSNP